MDLLLKSKISINQCHLLQILSSLSVEALTFHNFDPSVRYNLFFHMSTNPNVSGAGGSDVVNPNILVAATSPPPSTFGTTLNPVVSGGAPGFFPILNPKGGAGPSSTGF